MAPPGLRVVDPPCVVAACGGEARVAVKAPPVVPFLVEAALVIWKGAILPARLTVSIVAVAPPAVQALPVIAILVVARDGEARTIAAMHVVAQAIVALGVVPRLVIFLPVEKRSVIPFAIVAVAVPVALVQPLAVEAPPVPPFGIVAISVEAILVEAVAVVAVGIGRPPRMDISRSDRAPSGCILLRS